MLGHDHLRHLPLHICIYCAACAHDCPRIVVDKALSVSLGNVAALAGFIIDIHLRFILIKLLLKEPVLRTRCFGLFLILHVFLVDYGGLVEASWF